MLQRYLPGNFTDAEVQSNAFTSNPNFCFGNPVSHVYTRMQEGYFNPPHAADAVQLRDHCRVLYDHYIRNHYMNLLKKLLASRHAVMEKACNLASTTDMDGDTLAASSSYSKRKFKVSKQLRERAQKRAKL
ncbi:hypothetical protein AAVH_05123 [Aphelenchoides avenae]|nr:hypothetical protein AAVH_05123 [Aphelenchus avenae]